MYFYIATCDISNQDITLQDFTAHFETTNGKFSIKDITLQDFTIHFLTVTDDS